MPDVLMLREKWSYIKSFCFFYKSVNRSKDNEVIFSTEILISKQKRSQAKWMIKKQLNGIIPFAHSSRENI